MSKDILDANLIAIRELARQLAGENQKGVFDAIKGLLAKVSDRLTSSEFSLANCQNANSALLSQNDALRLEIDALHLEINGLMKAACCDGAKIAGLEEDLKKKNEEIFSLEILLANQEFATQNRAETKAAKTNPKGWKEIRNKLREEEKPWIEVKKSGRQTPNVGDVLSPKVDGKTAEDLLEKFEDQIRSFNIIDGKVDQKVLDLASVTTETDREAIYNYCKPCFFYKHGKCSKSYCTHPHFLVEKTTRKLYIQRTSMERIKEWLSEF